MSDAKRAYDLLRAYVGQEYERFQSLGLLDARKELDAALRPETQLGSTHAPKQSDSETPAPSADQLVIARQILGVTESATFEEIHSAYERLRKRSDPSKYPSDSAEQRQASEIHRRVNLAYQKLTESVSSVEKRFRSLEIED